MSGVPRFAARGGSAGYGAGTQGAIVLGEGSTALGVVRSLGRHGIPVCTLSRERGVASFSRYVRRRLRWPSGDSSDRLRYLLGLAQSDGFEGWTLFPTDDLTCELLARNHAGLAAHFRLTTPPWDVIKYARDKRLTYGLAAELELPHVWTRYPADRAEVAELDCPFPVILKPAMALPTDRFSIAKGWKVENRAELLARYDDVVRRMPADLLMIQEWIPGGSDTEWSYGGLARDGTPIASLTCLRLRRRPADFGTSTFIVSADEPAAGAAPRRILSTLRYSGLFEFESKRDPRDGSFKLLDFNPRAWGWHSAGGGAGVDFPYLCWRAVHGEQIRPVCGRSGVRWAYLSLDVLMAPEFIRRGEWSLTSYLWSLRPPMGDAVIAAGDPIPALMDVALRFQGRTRRWGIGRARQEDGEGLPTP